MSDTDPYNPLPDGLLPKTKFSERAVGVQLLIALGWIALAAALVMLVVVPLTLITLLSTGNRQTIVVRRSRWWWRY